MKGNQGIVDLLNEVLGGELVAINQYFLHAKMCKNWGFERLATKLKAESIEEMKHAETLIDRLLFLEGVPNLQKLGKINVGETVKEQLECDLALEMNAVKMLNDGLAACRDAGDNTSEELLRGILVTEEEHIDWIETQLGLIAQIGEAHYLAQHVHG